MEDSKMEDAPATVGSMDRKPDEAPAADVTESFPDQKRKTDDSENNTKAEVQEMLLLKPYFESKGVSKDDIQTTIRVLAAITDLSSSSRKDSTSKHSRMRDYHPSSKKRKISSGEDDNNATATVEEKKEDENDATEEKETKSNSGNPESPPLSLLLNEYRTVKELRPFRKALMQCYAKIVKPTLFDGHSSLGNYQKHKENLSLSKKRKMAENHQQRKHLANTMLRKGRIDKLNAKLEEGKDEEQTKLQARMMIPDGHVDTDTTTTTLAIENGSCNNPPSKNDASGQSRATDAKCSTPPEVETVDESGEASDGKANAATHAGNATELPKLRSCYVCKSRFRILHHFYDQLCPTCADTNWTNRHKTRDLTGKVAVVTGSRVKIGYQTCLKLLRAGCFVIATTRFPNAAAASYRAEPDFESWKDNLEIYGLDLRDVTGLELFCRYLQHKLGISSSADGDNGNSGCGLDILINNACQTIRRPTAYYLPACQREQELWKSSDPTHKALLKGCMEYEKLRRRLHLTNNNHHSAASSSSSSGIAAPMMLGGTDHEATAGTTAISGTYGTTSAVPESNGNTGNESPNATNTTITTSATSAVATTSSSPNSNPFESTGMSHSAAASQMIICPEDVGVDESVLPKGLSDINGQQLDLRKTNSWLLKMDQVSTPELMECMFVNAIAPFVLNSRLQPLLVHRGKNKNNNATVPNRYIVNVSAMEGKFYRYKMANHPHTNMAKSALNMMTRTAAEDLARNHSVYMNSIDTGWINDENPLEKAAKTAKVNNFQTPIDEIDAAARILDPILSDSKVYGKFLKDYRETEW